MANYKVPQDVEAEDKLLGPLTLKQFLFAMAFFGLLYLTYLIFLSNPFLSLLTLPMLIITGAFAFWQRKDQPVEVFFRSGILFFTKPHIRKWDQDGALKLVEVLVPKKISKRYTDGRSAQEVKSQLNEISRVLDTRGWNNRLGQTAEDIQSERLVPLGETPTTAHVSDFAQYDLEDQQEDNSEIAQNIQQQINETGVSRKEQIQMMMEQQLENIRQNVPGQTSGAEYQNMPISQVVRPSAPAPQAPQQQVYVVPESPQPVELPAAQPEIAQPQPLAAVAQPEIPPQQEYQPQPQQAEIPVVQKFDQPIQPETQPLPPTQQTVAVESDKITQAQSDQIQPDFQTSDELTEGAELDLH